MENLLVVHSRKPSSSQNKPVAAPPAAPVVSAAA